jgi:hypothetical protein
MRQKKHGLQSYDETDQALLYPHAALDSSICHSDCWRSVPEIGRKIKCRGPISLNRKQFGSFLFVRQLLVAGYLPPGPGSKRCPCARPARMAKTALRSWRDRREWSAIQVPPSSARRKILQPATHGQHLKTAEKRGAGLVSTAHCGSHSAVKSSPPLKGRRDPRR